MSYRPDISNFLVHFTKGEDINDAFRNLISIVSEMALFGNNGMIRGGHKCVCFSEAPLSAIKGGLLNSNYYSRYSPFGIMISKKWLFERGGRPVIYQKEQEYSKLTSDKWRHVTYDLTCEKPIDFTWEREWRINTDRLDINEEMCTIIVPNDEWAYHLIDRFEWEARKSEEQHLELIFSDPIMVELMASQSGHIFDWPILTLEKH